MKSPSVQPIPILVGVLSRGADRLSSATQAVDLLDETLVLTQVSPFYEDPLAEGVTVACVAVGFAVGGPLNTIRLIKAIEAQLVQLQSSHFASLRLELLFYGSLVLTDPRFSLPSPVVQERGIQKALLETVPNWVLPGLGSPQKLRHNEEDRFRLLRKIGHAQVSISRD